MGKDTRKPLTPKQQEVYDFIVKYTQEHLYSPSIREIGEGTNLKSTSSVFTHLINLELKGYIVRKCEQRSIKLVGFKLVREEV